MTSQPTPRDVRRRRAGRSGSGRGRGDRHEDGSGGRYRYRAGGPGAGKRWRAENEIAEAGHRRQALPRRKGQVRTGRMAAGMPSKVASCTTDSHDGSYWMAMNTTWRRAESAADAITAGGVPVSVCTSSRVESHPCRRRRALRRQAREPGSRGRRPARTDRFRYRRGVGRRPPASCPPGRRGRRLAGLHGARTGPRGGTEPLGRPLVARSDALHRRRGPPPVPHDDPASTLAAVLQHPPPPARRAGRLGPILDRLLVQDPARDLPTRTSAYFSLSLTRNANRASSPAQRASTSRTRTRDGHGPFAFRRA